MPSFYHLSPLFRRKPLSPERFAPVNARVGSLGTKKNPETINYRQEVEKYTDCIQPASLFVSTKRTFLRFTSL